MRRLGLITLSVLAPISFMQALAGPAPAYEPADTQTRHVRVDGTAPLPPKTKLGVQFHGTWSDYDRAERGDVLDKIRASGATWVRMDVGWSMIQPRSGEYDRRWAVPLVDEVIQQIRRRGLKVLVMFWQTPAWARDGGSERSGPSRPGSYARALGWAADRWGDDVGAWEVWNEPNSSSFFTGARPGEYVRLLCPAYKAVKANDPTARVVFGGTMYNDDDWIRRAYAAGAKNCFDVMATHPYLAPADAPPGTADDGGIWSLRHVRAVRSVMADFNDLEPIWATEFGWSTHSNRGGAEPWERGVTRTKQASYAVRALQLLRAKYPYVRKAFWYNARAKSTGDRHQDGFGLLTRDARPKPVHAALRRYYS